MTEHCYGFDAVKGDYARAAVGGAVALGGFALAGAAGIAGWAFGTLFILFAAFAARTALRQAEIFALDSEGLTMTGSALPWQRERRLAWNELERLRLRFFSTRRDRTSGWMQLKLGGRGVGITMDSTVTGFDDIAKVAVQSAVLCKVPLSRTTVANLAALGIRLEHADNEPTP